MVSFSLSLCFFCLFVFETEVLCVAQHSKSQKYEDFCKFEASLVYLGQPGFCSDLVSEEKMLSLCSCAVSPTPLPMGLASHPKPAFAGEYLRRRMSSEPEHDEQASYLWTSP